MRFSTAKFTEIAKTSILIILILNFFIIFFEIKYIEYIYLIIFFIFNFLVKIIEIKNYKNIYEKLKEMLKAKRNFFVAVNILIFFYIFKEPYFFLFKHKILILLGSVIRGKIMNQKERIDKMEKILNNSTKLLEELEEILNKLDKDSKNYNELVKYYYSKNWAKDKEDFEKDLLPDVEAAGVLTEDSIYDMMTTSSGLAIQMLELATKMLKR